MRAVALEKRELALRLEEAGFSRGEVCAMLQVSRSSIARWHVRLHAIEREPEQLCWRCTGESPVSTGPYLYLLGQYLGDGHIAPVGRGDGSRQVLRVYGDDAWPKLQDEVADAMVAVHPVKVFRSRKRGCHAIEAISAHWRCLLPQQGPGKKHDRRIVLAEWQIALVKADPRQLIRGLIHSDGCRTTNRVTTRGTPYAYPRYFFTNRSRDIQDIFTSSLDLLGIPWRSTGPNMISIARSEGVAALDAFVGPKS